MQKVIIKIADLNDVYALQPHEIGVTVEQKFYIASAFGNFKEISYNEALSIAKISNEHFDNIIKYHFPQLNTHSDEVKKLNGENEVKDITATTPAKDAESSEVAEVVEAVVIENEPLTSGEDTATLIESGAAAAPKEPKTKTVKNTETTILNE